MLEETVTIPLSEYKRLVEDADSLRALCDMGVDNWEGYGQCDWRGANEHTDDVLQNAPASDKITRFEIIDHRKCTTCDGKGIVAVSHATQNGRPVCPDCYGLGVQGRSVIFFDSTKQVHLSLQDDNRTLKVFISDREAR
jgi:hypothetical protein